MISKFTTVTAWNRTEMFFMLDPDTDPQKMNADDGKIQDTITNF